MQRSVLLAWLGLLLACGPGGDARLPAVPGETIVWSFLEESGRIQLGSGRDDLSVKVLTPADWRAGDEGDQRPCYSMPAKEQVVFDVSDAPPEAELVMQVAVRKGHHLEEGRVSLQLSAGGAQPVRMELDTSEEVPYEERRWRELRLPLQRAAVAELRLDYEGTRKQVPHILISELTVRVPSERLPQLASKERPNIVLVVIDTLRADALGTYGYERATTPTMDAFAERGILFERAYSAAPWTMPSTISIMTGLTPAEHGVDFDSTRDPLGTEPFLAESHETLAEILREEGFSTGGFSCNPLVSRRSNAHQGFDHFQRYGWAQADDGPVDDALAWLDTLGPERKFLYLHLVDPHAPYEPDEDFQAMYSAPEPASFETVRDGSLQKKVWDGVMGPEEVTAAIDHARLLYDGEVASVDAELGRFFEELERRGLLENSLIAITSDHGEEFGEYGAIGHVNNLYDPTLRVPLLLTGPDIPSGVRLPFPVENRRLGSTLLRLADVETRRAFTDVPLIDQERADGPIFFSTRQGRTRMGSMQRWIGYEQLFGVLVADRLLHWIPANERRPERMALYDLTKDPEARKDLSRELPDEAQRLRKLIRDWIERGADKRNARGARSIHSSPDLEALRGLGYLDESE